MSHLIVLLLGFVIGVVVQTIRLVNEIGEDRANDQREIQKLKARRQ